MVRRADLDEATVREVRDAVAHREGFERVVGDHEHRRRQVVVQLEHERAHVLAERLVESAERFVEQHRARTGDEGAGEGDPLALASRELVHAPRPKAAQLDAFEHLVGPFASFGLGNAANLKRKGDVVEHAHVGEQARVLEDHRHVAALGREVVHRLPVEEDRPAALHRQPAQDVEQRAFTGARSAEHRDERPMFHVKRYAVKHGGALDDE